ncbi:MAG: hypothetical protein Q9201_000678 [Fulgogasparrea decipioides]
MDNPNKEPIYLPVKETYDQWATIYDSDGNFLQALDSMMMKELLPRFIDGLPANARIADLGCGTGRNTCHLLRIPEAKVFGLDISSKMIERAKDRCRKMQESLPVGSRAAGWKINQCDITSYGDVLLAGEFLDGVHAMISTLTIEHVPLKNFFDICYMLLRPGGLLLITNMHSAMGATSQAGFVDQATGIKRWTTSYIHTIDEVLDEAKASGFTVLRQPEERAVRENDVEKLGERARKWVGVKVWFGVILQKQR